MRHIRGIALLSLAAWSISSAGFIMPPYLQAVTSTSIYVLVESDTQDTVTVHYGLSPAYEMIARTSTVEVTTALPATYVHAILLEGLSPNTVYHYSARQGGTQSVDNHFRTAVLPGTPFRFAWMADNRTGVTVFDSIMVQMSAAEPLLAMFGGDLCSKPSYGRWKKEFFREPLQTFSARVPWVNAVGNHESWTTDTKAFTQAPCGSTAQDYFSFDCGDMHVLVLSTERPPVAGSAQYLFADGDLGASTRRWNVVMFHKPAYVAGEGHAEDTTMIAMSTALFEKHGVDLVLTGHSHFYQHNLINGIHHLVLGSAGAPLYTPWNASYTVKSVKDYNWAIGDVTPTMLRLLVLNAEGVLLDTLELRKPDASREPHGQLMPEDMLTQPNGAHRVRLADQKVSRPPLSMPVMCQRVAHFVPDVDALAGGVQQAGEEPVPNTGSGSSTDVYLHRRAAPGIPSSRPNAQVH